MGMSRAAGQVEACGRMRAGGRLAHEPDHVRRGERLLNTPLAKGGDWRMLRSAIVWREGARIAFVIREKIDTRAVWQ